MSSSYLEDLVAHFLQDRGLTATLEAFEQELNRKFRTADLGESLSAIVADRINFDQIQRQREELGGELPDATSTPQERQLVADKGLHIPKWSIGVPKHVDSLHFMGRALIIAAQFGNFKVAGRDLHAGLFSTSDKSLFVYDVDNARAVVRELKHLPVALKTLLVVPNTDRLVTCGMDGTMALTRLAHDDVDDTYSIEKLVTGVKLHKRLITVVSLVGDHLCSVGWDSCLNVVQLGESTVDEIDSCKLLTKPTCVLGMLDRDSGLPIFLVGRVDSSLLSVFTLVDGALLEVSRLSLNDSEFSNYVFSPMCLVQTGDSMVTIATNHVPYMRLITIYVPSLAEQLKQNKYYDAKLDLGAQLKAVADAEQRSEQQLYQANTPVIRGIIASNLNSMTPQDKYSSPIVTTRPLDKEGLWIFGDDGIIRGYDLERGQVTEELKGNEGRIKAAFVGQSENDEVIVTCGAMDRTVTEWR